MAALLLVFKEQQPACEERVSVQEFCLEQLDAAARAEDFSGGRDVPAQAESERDIQALQEVGLLVLSFSAVEARGGIVAAKSTEPHPQFLRRVL